MSCTFIPASCHFHSSYLKALLGMLLIGLSLMLVSCDAGLRAGKYPDAEAEPRYQRALQITETALGPDHPLVAIRLNNLALLYQTQGKYAEAEPLYKRSYGIFLSRFGPDHPNALKVFGNYQDFLKTSGQASDKETVIRKLQ